MTAVNGVERAIRRVHAPAKINLASFGNQVPHVHRHIISRHSNDSRFPLPVWAPRQRTVSQTLLSNRRAKATLLREAVRAEMVLAFGQPPGELG